jgi:class 3 adenylate cyclase
VLLGKIDAFLSTQLITPSLKSRIGDFNARQRSTGAPVFNTRFGVRAGDVLVGSVGARNRFQYTAMGDVLNVASRLEGLNKEFGTTILVSAAVDAAVKSSLRFRPLGPARVSKAGKKKSRSSNSAMRAARPCAGGHEPSDFVTPRRPWIAKMN